jgi:hypothetical protein
MKLKKNQLKRTKKNPKSTKLVYNSGYKIMIILYRKQIRKNYQSTWCWRINYFIKSNKKWHESVQVNLPNLDKETEINSIKNKEKIKFDFQLA